MQQASRISDKTAFFLGGDLIEFNSTKQMFLEPAHKETKIILLVNWIRRKDKDSMLRVQFEEDLEKLHNQFYAMGNEVLFANQSDGSCFCNT